MLLGYTTGPMLKRSSREPTRAKNPAAVALGRLGGLKSAAGRMQRLSPARRRAIARRAARARWSPK